MRTVVIDSSTLITLSMNCLLWTIDKLNDKTEFYITEEVGKESIYNPLNSEKWAFGAIRINKSAVKTMKVFRNSHKLRDGTEKLLELINNTFYAKGRAMKIIHRGEIESVVLAKYLSANVIATDEKTMRLLIEAPNQVKNLLESKLHTSIRINNDNFRRMTDYLSGIEVLRSVDLISYCFEKGYLDSFLAGECKGKKKLIWSLLWGLKYSGCAISRDEINEYIRELI